MSEWSERRARHFFRPIFSRRHCLTIDSLNPERHLFPVGHHVQRGRGVTSLDVYQETLAVGAGTVEEMVGCGDCTNGTKLKQGLGSASPEIARWPGLHRDCHKSDFGLHVFQEIQFLAVATPAWLPVRPS